jgi:hypothetical protein
MGHVGAYPNFCTLRQEVMTRVFDTQGNTIVVVAAATLRTAGSPILPCNVDWRGHECAARLRVCGEPQWYDVQMPFCVCSFPWHSIGEKAVVLQNVVFLFAHVGANGRTGQQWKRMLPDLNARLGKDCHLRSAAYDSVHWLHAVEIARKVRILLMMRRMLKRDVQRC